MFSGVHRVTQTYVQVRVTLCTPEKGRLVLLPILSVSLLHSSALTSGPSHLAGKGEEHWHQKTQTYTTHPEMVEMTLVVSYLPFKQKNEALPIPFCQK